jgi:hypothetical protein
MVQNLTAKIDKFEQELCRNDAMTGILDGKSTLKRVKRGGLVVRADELATFSQSQNV